MATKKKSPAKESSTGSTPKAKSIVKKKMQETMHEFKHHELKSGRSGKTVRDPKQAIAIALSEARHSGAEIPPDPNQKKRSSKNPAKKKAAKKPAAQKRRKT